MISPARWDESKCEFCGEPLPEKKPGKGRKRKYCDSCQKHIQRERVKMAKRRARNGVKPQNRSEHTDEELAALREKYNDPQAVDIAVDKIADDLTEGVLSIWKTS